MMYNEAMAKAIGGIDEALIAGAWEAQPRRSRRGTLVKLCAAAACAVLVCSGALLLSRMERINISVYGNNISDGAVTLEYPVPAGAAQSREMPEITIPLDISAEKDTRVRVSAGTLSDADSENTLPLSDGVYLIAEKAELLWSVPGLSTENEYTMTVGEKITLTLCYDKNTSTWILVKK